MRELLKGILYHHEIMSFIANMAVTFPAAVPTLFTTSASLTARPFFTARGYLAISRRWFKRGGIEFSNYLMEKQI